MATQQDLQDLLRLLTVGRKVPMMQAMTQIKALQAVDLRSIKQIAESPLKTVESAIVDEKAARALQSACKAAVKRGDLGASANKRPAPQAGPLAKRARTESGDGLISGPTDMTPQELERSLELPLSLDEERMAATVLQTNRAPLVLAFAVELLRYTMPEQPLSSRLSLGQAVVSANSRSKAVNIGLEKGPSADDEGWGEGQPRVRVLGREVAVLKRGGYDWRGDENVGGGDSEAENTPSLRVTDTQSTATTATLAESDSSASVPATTNNSGGAVSSGPVWAVSQPTSLKSSTFVARAAQISSPGQRKALMESLFATVPSLKTATHNAWAYRLKPPGTFLGGRGREESFDDGETGCGDLMLRVMREIGAVDTLVVLTRWYGGVMLGPDRWRLMRNCVTGALSERLRRTGREVALGGEAVWGLDLEAARAAATKSGGGSNGYTAKHQQQQHVVGMQIHTPEGARSYLLKSFATAPPPLQDASPAGETASPTGKTKAPPKKTLKALEAEKEENLGLLLGALRLLFDSWADHLAGPELDRRAWAWYLVVRPDVDEGKAGWGVKGELRLADILNLRRKA
ncbi:hypothetical protein B0T24DRAFT_608022 [Lasiosphaeria ovina]|uniref:Impact N-terminal domain-containing protein n=1 Tax=Lasiosphaeria ovina TaxID=92902 RepID=A0AAE0NMK2_9PEZI|nr:hypothetical protein B0T24DRAFT_608022 [Lasiosphaeria ovina]